MRFIGIGILSWVTWLPLLGALLLLLLIPKNDREKIRYFANFWSTLCLLVTATLFWGFNRELRGLQYIEDYSWIPALGARYQLGVDGISLLLIAITALLGSIATLSSWSAVKEREKEYYAFLLALQTGMIGTFAAADMFLFYVFWEVMLVPMYFLIGIWGSERRLYSAIKFFLYTLFGSVVMLLALVKLYLVFPGAVAANPEAYNAAARLLGEGNPQMMAMLEHARASGSTFNIWAMQAAGSLLPIQLQLWLFVGLALGFAIKVPVFPFHTWLPDAHTDAPTAGSIILAGILLKMGTYGFLRFNLPMLPEASRHPRVVSAIAVLSIIGIVYGALCAMAQKDMKRLVAYSSVSHLGFVMLGTFALNPNGITGSVLQQLNHAISTGALFLLVGMLYERRHTRQISEFGGIVQRMPRYGAVFMIITLSSIGMPLLNGFIGEFLLLRAVLEARLMWAVMGGLGIVLGAAYMLWLYQRVFFGPLENERNKTLVDMDAREWVCVFPLVVLAFWIGIYPRPVLDYIAVPVKTIVKQVRPDYYERVALTEHQER